MDEKKTTPDFDPEWYEFLSALGDRLQREDPEWFAKAAKAVEEWRRDHGVDHHPSDAA